MKSSIWLIGHFAMLIGSIAVTISHPSSNTDQVKRQILSKLLGGKGSGDGASALSRATNIGSGDCKKYMIISARGTGENQVGPIMSAGFISDVLASVPGGGDYEVVYPASIDYLDGPGQGAADALRFITAEHSRCPKTRYVMIGYSEGAMVITQLMKQPTIPASKIVAIVLYGNPYFKGGAPQNSCSAKSGAGVAFFTGVEMPAKFSKITFDCCLEGDMICQTIGTLIPHLSYCKSPSERAAVDFVVKKL